VNGPALTVGLLHPGRMGAAVGAQARAGGARVLWLPEGRSEATAQRAEAAGLEPADDLEALLVASDLVLSVCPPAVAEDVAQQVAEIGFGRIYVDANAISPQRAARIAELMGAAGTTVVDGSIIGPPPSDTKTARLYLAGPQGPAQRVASVFAGTSVHPVPIDGGVGSASALKLAYSSFQKASRTLAAVAHALADAHGVSVELRAEAERIARPGLAEPEYLPSVAARAWRWAPEMLEAADALRAVSLPDDLAVAAARTMRCWDRDKDRFGLSLGEVLDHLHEPPDE
jgi:3-hydroxyisobutyrate dehydrogenase-like beta-hydroxyacid dehydrogenase